MAEQAAPSAASPFTYWLPPPSPADPQQGGQGFPADSAQPKVVEASAGWPEGWGAGGQVQLRRQSQPHSAPAA